MTIRIYPSKLQGEPLETHEHGNTTLHEWLTKNVNGYRNEGKQPICIEVNGCIASPEVWKTLSISADAEVRIYPIPYGLEAVTIGWIAVGIAVATAAYSIFMMQNIDVGGYSSSGNGDQLELNPAKANSAKLGDPIREVFGRYRIFPDYLVQPVSRFDKNDPKIYRTQMFLSVGRGNFSINASNIKIGNTPISSFGDDVSYSIYQQGVDVSGDERSQNWYNSTEVGTTTAGTTGLDLSSSAPKSVSVNAEAVAVSGNSLTMINASSSDDVVNDTTIPESWKEGSIITIEAPDNFVVKTESGNSVIYGDMSELSPYVGQSVTLVFNDSNYDLFVKSYTPRQPAVPGVGGVAAAIESNESPRTYDFTLEPETFSISWQGAVYYISLLTDYVTMSGLINSITTQLVGSGLAAWDVSGRVVITEESSPYIGGSILASSLPDSVFGAEPRFNSGVPSSGGTPAIEAHISLAYDSSTGTSFTGLPEGAQRLSLGLKGNQYKITAIDGLTISVQRFTVEKDELGNDITVIDVNWQGFRERTLLDFSVTGVNDEYNWIGPFLACPDSETTDHLEMNIVFPAGLASYDKKGRRGSREVKVAVQYRAVNDTDWTTKEFRYSRSTEDQIGFTEVFELPSQAQYEVRMRRVSDVGGGSTRDQCHWQALRARLKASPRSYEGLTTIAVTVRTGNRLAAQSDRRINIIATRLYGNNASRSIKGALYHVLYSLGMDNTKIDGIAIDELHDTYWSPRNELFDWSSESSSDSALSVLQKICNAGMGYFLLSDGLASVGREGVKSWTGIISPQETTEDLQTAFSAPSQDDYDGVDVTYINGTTWAEETIQCRTESNLTPSKIENYTLDGVLSPDIAYRLGMRRLMKYRQQRLTFSTSTELDALCYNIGDRIVLTDDIPSSETMSCLIIDMEYDQQKITLQVNEPLDWGIDEPRCLIRLQDGSASKLLNPSQVDEFTLTIPYDDELSPESWIMNDPYIEPLRLIFCSSKRVGYDGIIQEISPSSDGTCQITAKEYKDSFYQYDDAEYSA
ncbi:host specificity factor TipJ family phage tail protein [Providencia rettgeri]|uniref:host specificity factor TipJ family phage tail protein n=1 Tax=Providencia rettgeri TaxID=587 RepID=UPI0018C81F6E|nr:kinase [Providencia rettgeri]